MARRAFNPDLKAVWLTKPKETYPVIACMVVAAGWCAYMSGR